MKRTLNIGCGNDFFGTDRIDLYKTPATTKVCNVEKRLPYKSNTFDFIKAEQVLEHIKNMGCFVDECYRVLKPNGKIWLKTDNSGFLGFHLIKRLEHNKLLEEWYNKDKYGHIRFEDNHYHLFTPSHLSNLLKKFKQIEINYSYMNSNSWKGRLCKLLPKNLGASQIEVNAIK